MRTPYEWRQYVNMFPLEYSVDQLLTDFAQQVKGLEALNGELSDRIKKLNAIVEQQGTQIAAQKSKIVDLGEECESLGARLAEAYGYAAGTVEKLQVENAELRERNIRQANLLVCYEQTNQSEEVERLKDILYRIIGE